MQKSEFQSKSPLTMSRYNIALALGYVKHTPEMGIPFSTEKHLSWHNGAFEYKLRRELNLQEKEMFGDN